MPAIRGITVAVGSWYAKTLSICLPRNMRHLTECLVVTKPGDPCVDVARSVPGVRVLETDAFTRPGSNGVVPSFNKGLSVEEGIREFGRHGWILIHDADILLPDVLDLDRLRPDALHGARRRTVPDIDEWSPEVEWTKYMPERDGGPIGYFQLFRADAAAIKDEGMWYDVTYPHGGGCDARFLDLWKTNRGPIVTLKMDVLHLGPVDKNWFGTDAGSHALMAKYSAEFGLRRAMKNFTSDEARDAGEIPGRLHVPGYPPPSYLMPFERRMLMQRGR